MTGDHWYYTFLKRHPELSLRQPEATSIGGACGFNRKAVSDFFDLLDGVIDKSKLTGTLIFNMCESGLISDQKPRKVLSVNGKKQVGGLTSGERGSVWHNNDSVSCEWCWPVRTSRVDIQEDKDGASVGQRCS